MQTVSVGRDFFIKERNAYAEPWQAFWRELFQNADDAIRERFASGKGRIDITISPKNDNDNEYNKGCIVEFKDNGVGMSEETIRNVFMVLGETTKTGGTTGGFGRARVLTHFSMQSYEIYTQDNIVLGSGAEYEIRKTDEYVNGCHQTIYCSDATAAHLKYILTMSYLPRCQFASDVYVNGEKFTDWGYRRSLTRRLSFGNVHVNKSKSPYNCWIRVNGTWMFSRLTTANCLIIIEVDPEHSRKVLTSNRDGFNASANEELDRFLNEIATESESALKPRFKNKTVHRKGNGCRLSAKPVKADFVKAEISDNVGTPIEFTLKINNEPKESAIIQDARDAVNVNREIDFTDVYMIDETENVKMRRVFDSYDPINWEESEVQGRKFMKGGTKKKLLIAWQVACEYALKALHEAIDTDSLTWGIGWIFSDTALAVHSLNGGVHYLLINPVDKEGKMRFKLTGTKDLSRLFGIALHEVTHVHAEYHNETFAKIMTDVVEIGIDWRNTVIRAMRDAMAEA